MLCNRHTLIYLGDAARAALLPAVIAGLPEPMRNARIEGQVTDTLLGERIPGIACRPTGPCPQGGGQIGFSFPFRVGAARVRSAVGVSPAQITATLTPWEVMVLAETLGDTLHPAIEELRRISVATGVEIGLIGSVALQAVTGLGYTRPDSDIDLVVRATCLEHLHALAAAVHDLTLCTGTALDIEVALAGGIGAKLNELLSGSDAVLGKTIAGVELIPRARINAILAPGALQGVPVSDPQHPKKQAERRRLWM
ncbi:malonate decarboxylase holo-[acyl-carrier-protein] synthase [Rhodobacter maris]|uniref:Phosphoribosyl-dephospho-CoA transferase n=1 Tax=Rhodobacter maris TaxID=446682 RepID=A0A285TB68_9RHOB|nr:malonate decarboxylase holo-[acyl-carrier-protein] synthase [Rhodobacter maris]SOC19116.1 phosphoribosyl-dephospho-CoA transferase [Rhodobacter maris]